MASGNMELVRSIYTAWERGDFASTEWAHPEIEWWITPDGPSPAEGVGVSAMAQAWGDFLGAWENYRVVADEYRELDAERVLVLLHLVGRGKTSGLELEQMRTKAANLVHVQDGRVTTLVVYFDRESAFADLGLKE